MMAVRTGSRTAAIRAALVVLAASGGALATTGVMAQFGPVARPGDWVPVEGARLRLLLGSATPDGTVRGALEIDLEPGWKTYWIAPGPVGIPPHLDAARSTNLVLDEVGHPAPGAFTEFGEVSVGYKEDVAFALRFTVPDPDAPSRLALSGFLGVCEEICVPVALRVEGDVVTGQSTPFATGAAIRAAWAAVPPEGKDGSLAARVEGGDVVLSGPALDAGAEAFVALPDSLTLGVARRDGETFRATVLRGEPAGTLDVVVRDGAGATHYRVPIDPGR